MKRALLIIMHSVVAMAAPGAAEAYEKELGFSISPMVAGLSPVAGGVTQGSFGWALGGGLGFEYNPTNTLAVVIDGGYMQALSDSLVGSAVIEHRQGQYYFQQSVAFGELGLRISTPAWWMPIQLGLTVEGGFAVLWQAKRVLLDSAGNDLQLGLSDVVFPAPLVTFAPELLARVYHQIRIDTAPTFFLIFGNQPSFGFGVKISLTFLFYP